jgi:transposase
MIVKEIATRVGLGRRTIQRWVKEETSVETNYHHSHRSRFDAYARLGSHSDGTLDVILSNKSGRARTSDGISPFRLCVTSSPRTASWPREGRFSRHLLIGPFFREEGAPFSSSVILLIESEKEQEELATIRQGSETAETIYQLVQAFLQMVRQLEGSHLESWLRSVRACHIPELHRFANGIEQDKAAVLVGLTLFHNNSCSHSARVTSPAGL